MSRQRPGLRKISGALVLGYLLFGSAPWLAGRGPDETRPAKPAFGPLQKSLLLPGWGQLAERHYGEGALFLAAELGCLAGALANNHLSNENYSMYRKAESMEDAVNTRRLTEKYDTRRNQFLLAAAAIWAVNLIDIYFIVSQKAKKNAAVSLRIERGENQHLGITACYRF